MADTQIFWGVEIVRALIKQIEGVKTSLGLTTVQAGTMRHLRTAAAAIGSVLDAVLVVPIEVDGDCTGSPFGVPDPSQQAGEEYLHRILYFRRTLGSEQADMTTYAKACLLADRIAANTQLSSVDLDARCIVYRCWPSGISLQPPELALMEDLDKSIDVAAVTVSVTTKVQR